MHGVVENTFVTPRASESMPSAVANGGLRGDRYERRVGYWSGVDECEVTLIEGEDRADHFNVNLDRSTDGLGNFGSMRSRVSTMICDTAMLRNHFLFDGMTNHGAADELHRLSAAS